MRKFSVVILLLFGLLIRVAGAAAQSEEFRLNMHRTFGFSSGSLVRGTFSLDIVPTTNIKSVTYLIDGKTMAVVTGSPYSLSFQTTQYSNGLHELSALVETLDGRKVATDVRRFEFATSEQESAGITNIIFPLLGGVLVLMTLGIALNFLVLRKQPKWDLPLGTPRSYGLAGGGVCPRCHRPFALHWWAPNMGLGTKFDRCDFCGSWGIIRRQSRSSLVAAEAAELQNALPLEPVKTKTAEEHLREQVENSRYINQ